MRQQNRNSEIRRGTTLVSGDLTVNYTHATAQRSNGQREQRSMLACRWPVSKSKTHKIRSRHLPGPAGTVVSADLTGTRQLPRLQPQVRRFRAEAQARVTLCRQEITVK